MFDTPYLVNWMKNLLEVLWDKNIHNVLVVMDNAEHHKVFPREHRR